VILLSQLKNISGAKLTYLAATTAIAISQEFDTDDANILSGFFNSIGDNLGLIAAQQEALKNSISDSKNNSSDTSNSDNKNNSSNSSNSDNKNDANKDSEGDKIIEEKFI
jgi:hypothetical protein